MILTWLEPSLVQLAQLRGRLPHALLVHGPDGVGQFELAMAFARFALCERPSGDGQGCGQCGGCTWFDQGNHPDFRLLQPESMAGEDAEGGEVPADTKKKSDQIKIAQVRNLQRFLAVGTHRAGLRVIVVHPAEAMNTATQNALLKSLEEPPPETLFLLVTGSAHRLLATIRSRCQSVAVGRPTPDQAEEWLKRQKIERPGELLALAGGAPLHALRLSGNEPARRRLLAQLGDPEFDLAAASEHCLTVDPATAVGWLQRWAYDLLSHRLTGLVRYHLAPELEIPALAARCDPAKTALFLRMLAKAASLAQHPLNPRLFFEDILIQYRALIANGGR